MKKKTKFWSVATDQNEDKLGHLYLYGVIASETWWCDEVTPNMFREDIASLGDIDTLRVHIFSNGGDVFAGHAILSQLKQHPAFVEAYIEGIAASMATVVPMGADAVYISTTGMMLVHKPMAGLLGYYNTTDLADIMTDLDKIREPIIGAYTSHTGVNRDEVVGWIEGENGQGTWFTAEEAIEAGLVDGYIPAEVEENLEAVAAIGGGQYRWRGSTYDLSAYAPMPNNNPKRKENPMGRFFDKFKKVKNAKENESTIEVTCPECGHVFSLTAESGDEVTCPECGHVFTVDTTEGDSSDDGENNGEGQEGSDGEGGGEGGTEGRFNAGIAAERERIASLDSILDAVPQAKEIVAEAKKDGIGYAEATKAVFAMMQKTRQDAAEKGEQFLAARKDALKPAAKVGAAPNNGNAEDEDPTASATALIVDNFKK